MRFESLLKKHHNLINKKSLWLFLFVSVLNISLRAQNSPAIGIRHDNRKSSHNLIKNNNSHTSATGTTSDVKWLDDKHKNNVVGSVNANEKPYPYELPLNDLVELNVGETKTITFRFRGGENENNQIVTISSDRKGLCNTSVSVNSNDPYHPIISVTILGNTCNLGEHTIDVTGTDNGSPSLSETFPLKIRVNDCGYTSMPEASDRSICINSSASLTASQCSGVYKWYASNTDGIVLSSNATYNTPTLSTSKSYFVSCINNNCESQRKQVFVTVHPYPAAPGASATSICAGTSTTINASGCDGGTYKWYTSNGATTPIHYEQSYTTPTLNATATYYVSCTVNDCEGPRKSVIVTVNPRPGAPSANGTTLCAGSSTTLGATGCSGTYKWFASNVATSPLASTASYNTPVLSTTTNYFVSCTTNNCESVRTQVTVTVNPNPAAPNASSTAVCTGNSTTLTATACSGTYRWYASNTDTGVLASTNSYTTPLLSTTTSYFVSCTVNNCQSVRRQVTVTVNPYPGAPSSAGNTICAGSSTALTATGCTGTYKWYFSSSATAPLSSAASYTTPVLNATTSYYITCTTNNCESTRRQITVTVNPNPVPPSASGVTICAGNSTPLTASGCAGTYKWYASNTATGPLVSTAGYTTPILNATTSYFVSCTVNNCQGTRRQVTVTVNPNPAAPNASSTAVCTGNATTLTATACSGTYRWYASNTATAVLASTASYATPALSTTTSYFVSCTVNNCPSVRRQVTVTVNPYPGAPSSAGNTICAGSSTALTATGCTGTYKWYFSSSATAPLSSTASYTTPVLNTTTSYYITCTTNNCESTRRQITVTVNPNPAAPSASGVTICAGSSTPLNASGCAGTYKWYASNTATGPLVSTAGYTTPVLNTTTSYFVSCTVNNCQGARKQVTVTVNPNPAAPNASAPTICTGNSTSLTATGCAGTYKWYVSNTATDVLVSTASYTTPVLTTTTSYYVSCTVTNCPSVRRQVTVTVNPNPVAPTIIGNAICTGTSTTLTASGCSGTYRWYASNTATTVLASTASYTTPVLNATTSYFVECTLNTCKSVRGQVTVTVNPNPAVPGASATTICAGTRTTLTATGCAGTYRWYVSNTATSALASTASYTTPVLNANTTYFVSCTVNNCQSSKRQVTVPVTPASLALAGASGAGTQRATQIIVSEQLINAQTNTIYYAGNSITLNPGFIANTNSIFLAQINGCSN